MIRLVTLVSKEVPTPLTQHLPEKEFGYGSKSGMLFGYLGSGHGWLDVEGGSGGETLE